HELIQRGCLRFLWSEVSVELMAQDSVHCVTVGLVEGRIGIGIEFSSQEEIPKLFQPLNGFLDLLASLSQILASVVGQEGGESSGVDHLMNHRFGFGGHEENRLLGRDSSTKSL